jgi:formylglycine-generating enzyme required for sulfatase activity/uncharacterized protein with von Willebrand factor type A (vWA) domain
MDPQADHSLDGSPASPAPPSPLSAFLAVLRTRGVPIGVAQHLEATRLLSLLGHTCDVQSLARSLGALLGRDGKEARLVENLFLDEFAEAFRFPDYGDELPAVRQAALRKLVDRAEQTTPADDIRRRRRASLRWALPRLLLLIVAGAVGGVFWLQRQPSPPAPTPPPMEKPQGPTDQKETKPDEAEATPPDLHNEPPVVEPRWALLILLSIVGTLPLSAIWFVRNYGPRRKRARKEHARAFWSKAREQLEGPVAPQLRLPPVPPPLDRGDLDDMATLLGRSDEKQRTRQIDGEGTARATIALGNTPKLVWRERKLARRLLILCDVCSDMRPWEHKTTALIDGLRRRGVPMTVRYFDGSADLLRADEDSAYEPLALTLQQSAGSALLVLSTGRDARDPQRPGQLARWIRAASERVPLRVWLNPLSPRRLWRPELKKSRFPMRVLPMTGKGLTAAAYELALGGERRLHIPDERVQPAREASEVDAGRLEELISLYPDAPLAVVQWLWRRFLPDVPDDVLALVLDEEDVRWNGVQWSDERLAAALNRLRARDKSREAPERVEEQVRRELFRLLDDSAATMPRDSVGQLRLRLLSALQQLNLHGPGDQEQALSTLRALLRGPIYSEVAEAIGIVGGPEGTPHAGLMPVALPTIDALRDEFPQLVQSGVEYVAEVSSDAKLPKGDKPEAVPWPRPLLREVAPALGLPLLALLGLWGLGWWGHPVPPEAVYRLTVQTTEGEQVRLQVEPLRAGLPTSGRLCQDAACAQSAALVWDAGNGFVRTRTQERQEIHLRARLRGGKLLYSNAVVIPKLLPPAQPPPVAPPPKPETPPVAEVAREGSLRVLFVDAVTGRPVPGVRYSVTDAKNQRRSGAGTVLQHLPIGPAKVQAQAPGYLARALTVEVKPGLEQELSFPLSAQPPPVAAASPPDMASPPPPPDLSSPPDLTTPPPPPPPVAFRRARPITIPGGTFTMGSERSKDETPAHPVTVSSFLLDDIEVTVGAYAECVASGACTPADTGSYCNAGKADRQSHPINCVDYAQAQSYCRWRGGRLPTEEEWEYAARGSDGREYPWGAAQPSPRLLNVCGSECVAAQKKRGQDWRSMYSGDDGWPETAPVGSYPDGKSPFGALDLAGNVWEWVDGWYCSDGYKPGVSTRDERYKSGCRANSRVLRGGSWDSEFPTYVRAAYRYRYSPVFRYSNVGFRCARTNTQ